MRVPRERGELLVWVAIGEDQLSTTARQLERLQAEQFLRFFLVGPEKHFGRPLPQCGQRLLGLEDMRSIGKLRPYQRFPLGACRTCNWTPV